MCIPARSNNWAFVGAGANGHLVMNWINGFTNGMNQIPTIPQNLAHIASRIRLPRPVKNEHLTICTSSHKRPVVAARRNMPL
jgi:hypothetical protein